MLFLLAVVSDESIASPLRIVLFKWRNPVQHLNPVLYEFPLEHGGANVILPARSTLTLSHVPQSYFPESGLLNHGRWVDCSRRPACQRQFARLLPCATRESGRIPGCAPCAVNWLC